MREWYVIRNADGKVVATIHDGVTFLTILEDFERACRHFQQAIDEKDAVWTKQSEMHLRGCYLLLRGSRSQE